MNILNKSKKKNKNQTIWWQNQYIILIIILFLSILDALNLYSTLDDVTFVSAFINITLAIGIALCLNFIPMLIAHLWRQIYFNESKVYKYELIGLIVIFTILFIFVFNARWSTRELLFNTDELVDISNNISENVSTTPTPADSPSTTNNAANNSIVLLLAIFPLITSSLSLYLSYISDDFVSKKLQNLDEKESIIEEELILLEAQLKELDNYEIRIKALVKSFEDNFIIYKKQVDEEEKELINLLNIEVEKKLYLTCKGE